MLTANGLHKGYAHVLTGYIGSASFLRAVIRTVQSLRAANPAVTFSCDPVMGDAGKLYVPEELCAIYREEVVPLAAVLTPNRFEAELLTGLSVRSVAEAAAACRALHARGPHTVVITSLDDAASGGTGGGGSIVMVGSRQVDGGETLQWSLRLPRIPQHFTGSGDLTTALILAWSHRLPQPPQLAEVLERVGASLQAVLQLTRATNRSELCLVQVYISIYDIIMYVNRSELYLVQLYSY